MALIIFHCGKLRHSKSWIRAIWSFAIEYEVYLYASEVENVQQIEDI